MSFSYCYNLALGGETHGLIGSDRCRDIDPNFPSSGRTVSEDLVILAGAEGVKLSEAFDSAKEAVLANGEFRYLVYEPNGKNNQDMDSITHQLSCGGEEELGDKFPSGGFVVKILPPSGCS